MKLLLDTHVALWMATGDERLGLALRQVISDEAGAVFVSVASLWEMRIKANLGKLHLPAAFTEGLAGSGLAILPVNTAHINALDGMPAHHNDPFDRMLVAQARVEGMTLVSADRMMRLHDVPVLWS